LLNYTAGN